jgi:hypothetical protein
LKPILWQVADFLNEILSKDFSLFYHYYYTSCKLLRTVAVLGVRLILRLKFWKMLRDEVRPEFSPAVAQ